MTASPPNPDAQPAGAQPAGATPDARTAAKAPTVSVLMSVYSAERYVEQAIRSVLNQTFRDLEMIVIDDGSSDGSIAIVERLAREDARIRFSARPNKGIPATANEMIGLARGRYLSLMDHDDVMLPDCIATEVAYLDTHPNVVVVGIMDDYIDGEGRTMRRRTSLKHRLTPITHMKRDLVAFPPHIPFVSNPGSMMRAEAVRRVGGYREVFRYASDNDLWFRMSEVGEIHRLHAVQLNYRKHERNTTVLHRETVLMYDVVVILSAAARHHGLDDRALVAGFRGRDNYSETIDGYRTLLGARYPVETYLLFRAVRNRIPGAVGESAMAPVLTRAFRHALSTPPSMPKLKLLRRSVKARLAGVGKAKPAA